MELVPVGFKDPRVRQSIARERGRIDALAPKLHRFAKLAWLNGRGVREQREKDIPMGIPAILIAAAISLTMLVMVSDLP
jgi:hypothetical protein